MLLFLSLFLMGGDEALHYGSAIKAETETVTIEAFAANPESYLGKVVKLEGTVKEVCPKAGCWLDIASDGKTVRIKVKDGEMVFEQKLVGRKVIAEGTVYKFDLDHEQAIGYYQHLAEEKGEAFDAASVPEKATIYQIGGISVATI